MSNGLDARLIDACHKPAAALTREDFTVLESWRPEVAAERRDEHARAVQVVLDRRERHDAAAAQRKAAPAAAAAWARLLSVEAIEELSESVLADPKALFAWSERHAAAAVPTGLVVLLYLAERVKRLELENRVAMLEQRPPLPYKGVWKAEQVYSEGDLTTYSGSMWYARSASVSRRPGSDPCWVLCVKRGADATTTRKDDNDDTR